MTLRLRPMREDEFASFRRAGQAEYADDIHRHGGLDAAAAARKAELDLARILPHGLATSGHVLAILERDGEPVGRVWFAEETRPGGRVLYVYDVHVDEACRGQGLGREAMLLVEAEARARGIRRVALNVFGGNEVARRLYRSLGYVESAVAMHKDL